MHNKEVQTAVPAPPKSLVSSGFLPLRDKGWRGQPAGHWRNDSQGALQAHLHVPGDPRARALPRAPAGRSLPARRQGAVQATRRSQAVRERRRGRAGGAGQAEGMDRFVWTSGLLEIHEALVIQQRGVRIYDGEEKVGRQRGPARPRSRSSARSRPACRASPARRRRRSCALAPTRGRWFPAGAHGGRSPTPP